MTLRIKNLVATGAQRRHNLRTGERERMRGQQKQIENSASHVLDIRVLHPGNKFAEPRLLPCFLSAFLVRPAPVALSTRAPVSSS